MRYAAPVAMPAGLGEWLGAELEARGVEAASLYARAVLSILLHSEADTELDRDPLDLESHPIWNPRAALELELRLERHNKETRRGRPSKKTFNNKSTNNQQHKNSGQIHQRVNNMASCSAKSGIHCGTIKRRPHSWNGDEEELKKCAAIECLLSATDDDQWPVEKLVDELCTRLKLLQLEQSGGGGKKPWAGLGSSAPECFECPSSDSDSFTSVSSPEVDQDNYRHDFPPLEYLSDSDQGAQPVMESIWNVRQGVPSSDQTSRVRFVRMAGTRLSPPPVYDLSSSSFGPQQSGCLAFSYGEASEAYFGDCSRDSSQERTLSPLLDATAAPSSAKGRLYERGHAPEDEQSLNCILSNAFKSLCQFHEEHDRALWKRAECDPDSEGSDPGVGDLEPLNGPGKRGGGGDGWQEWASQPGSLDNIWAPLDSDWLLLGSDPSSCWPLKKPDEDDPAAEAVQLSLALLNHHPERSSFTPVLPLKALPKNSKLMEWLVVGLGRAMAVDCDEKEVENILKKDPELKADEGSKTHKNDDDEEEENLLTSPKTHFCPIQQEGEVEVQVKDGATFDVDAQPEEVHFLRSPSGALYLPESEDNGDGWKGWTKYMVYKSPPSPSPPLLEVEPVPSRPTSPFTLKFRVIQTEKCCQTDPRLSVDNGPVATSSTPPLSISSPFAASFMVSTGLLDAGDVWKFDAEAISKAVLDDADQGGEETDGKEEVDGLLNEVWSVATLHDSVVVEDEDDDDDAAAAAAAAAAEEDEEDADAEPVEQLMEEFGREASFTEQQQYVDDAMVSRDSEYDLDELWNPFMEEAGQGQVDVCEWIPQPYDEPANWVDEVGAAESWPPPNIPVEYFDDEFLEEVYGSLDSKASESVAAGGAGGGKNRRHSRRRRRISQKQPPVQRRRPCSFFVEGECRRPDCKFSHDLGSITCRFWIESSCFKGDACPFLHGLPSKDSDRNGSYPHSDAELSESYGSEDVDSSRFHKAALKKFQFDLEADFPSLSQAADIKPPRLGGQSRPIPITHGFAAADNTASSQENGPADGGVCLKRRRRRNPCQRVSAVNLVGNSSESSPGDTVSVNAAGKRSRKVAKVTTLCSAAFQSSKKEKPKKNSYVSAEAGQTDRRRTKSEHDLVNSGSARLRLSSSYKEG